MLIPFFRSGFARANPGFRGQKNPNTDAPLGVPTIVERKKSRLATFVGFTVLFRRASSNPPKALNKFVFPLPPVSWSVVRSSPPWWQRVFDSVEPSPTPSLSPPLQLSRSAGIVLVSDGDSPAPAALRASDLPDWAPSSGDERWVNEFTRGGLDSLPRRQLQKLAGQRLRPARGQAPRSRSHRGPRALDAAVPSTPFYVCASSRPFFPTLRELPPNPNTHTPFVHTPQARGRAEKRC